MSRLKRIYLSILKQPMKSGFIFGVCILIAVSFTISLSLFTLSLNTKSNLINSLPPAGYINIDIDKRYQYSLAYPEQSTILLKKSIVEDIMKRPHILAADYNINADLQFSNIRLNEASPQTEQSYLKFIGYDNHRILGVLDNQIRLTEGRLLTQDELEQGLSSIIIHERLAKLNNLQLGDSITAINNKFDVIDGMWQVIETEEKMLKVVGFYETTSEKVDEFDIRIIFGSGEFIYNYLFEINNAIPGQIESEYLDFTLFDNGSIYLEFDTYEDSKIFRDALYEDYPNYLNLELSSDSLSKILDPIEKLLDISSIALLVSSISGAVIVISSVSYYVYSRKYEIGLYRLLGERTSKTFRIIVLEIYTIVIIGLAVGFVSGTLLSKSINSSIISNQFKGNEEVTSWISNTEALQYDEKPNAINQIIMNVNMYQLVLYYFAIIIIVLSGSTVITYIIFLKMNPVALML